MKHLANVVAWTVLVAVVVWGSLTLAVYAAEDKWISVPEIIALQMLGLILMISVSVTVLGTAKGIRRMRQSQQEFEREHPRPV